MPLPVEYHRDGFSILKGFLAHEEVSTLKGFILDNINSIYVDNNIHTYLNWEDLKHKYSCASDEMHAVLAPKFSRLFSASQISSIYQMNFLSSLESLIGKFSITQEENLGRPEIYWRITRPNQKADIGPLHADGWFWDLNPSWRPNYYTNRIKAWVPLEVEPGRNGLNVVPGSHRLCYAYQAVEYSGKLKPSLLSDIEPRQLSLLNMEQSDAVIFHDRLLHGGALNTGHCPRISFEFTCAKIDE